MIGPQWTEKVFRFGMAWQCDLGLRSCKISGMGRRSTLRWIAWLAKYGGVERLDKFVEPSRSGCCEASVKLERWRGDLGRSQRKLEGNEFGRSFLERHSKKLKRVGVPSAGDAALMGIRLHYGLVVNAYLSNSMLLESQIEHAHLLLLDHEDPYCHTETFADGSCMIKIASSHLSAGILIAEINSSLSAKAGPMLASSRRRRQIDSFLAGAAVARFYLLQQRLWNSSFKIMGHERGNASDKHGVAELAMIFTLAHELSHHILHHSRRDLRSSHQFEFDADASAYALLQNLTGSARLADAGAAVALFSVSLHEQGLLIRRGSTHPVARDRWLRLGLDKRNSSIRYLELSKCLEFATRDWRGLPEDCWESLANSNDWNMEQLPSHELKFIRTIEKYNSLSVEELCRAIEGLYGDRSLQYRRGLSLAGEGAAEAALTAWECSTEEVLNPGVALSFFSLVELLGESPGVLEASSGNTDPSIPTILATIAAHRIAPLVHNRREIA